MRFNIHCISSSEWVPAEIASDDIYLRENNWDDYGYRTTFMLSINDAKTGRSVEIGSVKIADLSITDVPGMTHKIHTEIPRLFRALPPNFVSLAQDPSVYSRAVSELGQGKAKELFASLNDLTFQIEHLAKLASERGPVASSLLRSVSLSTVEDQFRRILEGFGEKELFRVVYHPTHWGQTSTPEVVFEATPNLAIPANVHVIIGGNGAGKTTALRAIENSLVASGGQTSEAQSVRVSGSGKFGGILSVRFNAFDEPATPQRRSSFSTPVRRISLSLGAAPLIESSATLPYAGDAKALSTTEGQESFFRTTLRACLLDRKDRLLLATALLARADPLLDMWGIATEDGLTSLPFAQLSSGHKILLLTIVSLVMYCEERTLVLIDEPESHLHPPLLSAFTRALSELVTDRNGLALVTTHSPIVLQEVPRRCSWVLRRTSTGTAAMHPDIETFGENVDVLTREVFGLEAREAGYYTVLADLASRHDTYEEAFISARGELSAEAQLILRTMVRYAKRS